MRQAQQTCAGISVLVQLVGKLARLKVRAMALLLNRNNVVAPVAKERHGKLTFLSH
jgi:hypothetical protein